MNIESKSGFKTFSYPVVIKENHIDTFGHVNNATYLQLFEEARWEYITLGGFGLEMIRKTKLGPVILECKLRFVKEINLREKITIVSETIAYKKKIGQLKQVIFNEAGQICCEAEMVFGLFDTVQRKLVVPTPEWIAAIGSIQE